MSKTVKAKSIYELTVTLLDIEPPIWRAIQVRSDITLLELHGILQDTMGWTDSHLHGFDKDGVDYGTSDVESDLTFTGSEAKVRLAELLTKPRSKIRYDYDYGDGWEHSVVLERMIEPDPAVQYPRCIDGARACPPEDCGGPFGYASLLEVLADSKHPEHLDMMDWIGGEFDPEEFDIDEVNDVLSGRAQG